MALAIYRHPRLPTDSADEPLFEIINKIRKEYPSIDPELVQIVIQGELDRQVQAPTCTPCGSKAHKKYSTKKECVTTIGTLVIDCPYYVCPKCKAVHTPYENALNLRDGKYQYDVQKIASLFGSKETFEEAAEIAYSRESGQSFQSKPVTESIRSRPPVPVISVG
jgi:hypothetical protein